ncbi:hypothetical protein NBRC116493_15920 [Aurantivibrio infirmus]
MKVDQVTINTPIGGGAVWTSVTFQQVFPSTPVVFVLPTDTNADPASLRIRNVTTTGFEVGVVEPQGEDGQTSAMQFDYFAAETGTYNFPGGVRVVVATHSTASYQGKRLSGTSWDTINFPNNSFNSTPVVVAQVQTINSQAGLDAGVLASPWLEVAMRSVSSNSMQISLERAETNDGTVVSETIGYLAMESGEELSIGGETIKSLRTADNIQGWSNNCRNSNYPSSFSAIPLVVASQNTRDGGDGGWVRRCAISTSSVGMTIDEDRAADSERSHTTERVGLLAISAAFHGTRNGNHMEAGSNSIVGAGGFNTQWTTVSFPNPFTTTPHIFTLPTDQDSAPNTVRIRNVTINGFEITSVRPSGEAGAAPETTVDYIAIEPGEHTLPNGDVFEVGSIDTDRVQTGVGGSTGWDTINFSRIYSSAPAVLLQIQTTNNEPALDPNNVSVPWLVTAARNLTSTRIDVALDRAEAISGSVTQAETIAYFSVQHNSNEQLTADNMNIIDYEMFRSADDILGWDNGCYTTNFADIYTAPIVVAAQIRRDGSNGGWVRRCNLQNSFVGLTIDEDRANDTERAHTSESASVFVFSEAFEASFEGVTHFGISHGGGSVTCEAASITISPHDILHASVATTANIQVSATSATPGWMASDATWALVTGTPANFSVGPGAGQATYQFSGGETEVVLALANTSVADIDIDVLETISGTLTDLDDGGSEDLPLSFADQGLRFYADLNGDGNADDLDLNGTPDPIPTPLTSGSNSPQMIVRAIETNTNTGACQARVAGARSVDMAYECVNPTTCINNRDLTINGTAIEENNLNSVVDFQAVTLVFDAEGEAPFTVNYRDVGNIRLHAELTIPASGPDPAVTLDGISEVSTVRPASLAITTIESNTAVANPGTTVSGDGFIPAGEAFNVVVQVRNALGGLTPNFGNEIVSEGLLLNSIALVMPAGGNNPPLENANSFVGSGTAGEFVNNAVSWLEVGTITINASIVGGDYLGSGNLTSPTSGNVGRFYPRQLRLMSSSVDNGCSADNFTYMSDQGFSHAPVDINYLINAEYLDNQIVTNYDAALGYPVDTFAVVAENNNNGTNLASRALVPSGAWVQGELTVAGTDNGGFRRLFSTTEQVDGPHANLQLGIQSNPASVDPVGFSASQLTMNANSTGDCVAATNCDAVPLGSALNVLFARLYMRDTYGPESASLTVPFEVQYWNGSKFVLNGNDSCTRLARNDIRFNGSAISGDPISVPVGGGSTNATFTQDPTGNSDINIINGSAGLSFSAPGVGNLGTFVIDAQMTNYPWLRFDWNQNNDNADDTTQPSANINFGSYRGHDRVIFWREVLN